MSARLTPIYLTVFVDVLALSFAYPLLPFYAKSFGATPLVVGILFATFSLCQLVSAPQLGRMSDRWGRKPVLLASQLGTFVGLVIMALANRIEFLFLGRILDGLTAGNLSIAQATIADETTPDNRTRAFGFFGIAFGVGFLVGPATAGWLAEKYGFHVPPAAAAGLSLLSVVLTATLLPNKPPKPKLPQIGLFASIAQVARDPVLRPRVLELFTYVTSFAMLTGGLGLFLAGRLHFDVKEAGYAFAYSALVGALMQGGIGRLAKRLGERGLSAAGLSLMIVGYVILAFTNSLGILGVALALGGLGSYVVRPALMTLLTNASREEDRGRIFGVSQSATSLAQALGPALSGLIIGAGALSAWAFVAAAFAASTLAVRWLSTPRAA